MPFRDAEAGSRGFLEIHPRENQGRDQSAERFESFRALLNPRRLLGRRALVEDEDVIGAMFPQCLARGLARPEIECVRPRRLKKLGRLTARELEPQR